MTDGWVRENERDDVNNENNPLTVLLVISPAGCAVALVGRCPAGRPRSVKRLSRRAAAQSARRAVRRPETHGQPRAQVGQGTRARLSVRAGS